MASILPVLMLPYLGDWTYSFEPNPPVAMLCSASYCLLTPRPLFLPFLLATVLTEFVLLGVCLTEKHLFFLSIAYLHSTSTSGCSNHLITIRLLGHYCIAHSSSEEFEKKLVLSLSGNSFPGSSTKMNFFNFTELLFNSSYHLQHWFKNGKCFLTEKFTSRAFSNVMIIPAVLWCPTFNSIFLQFKVSKKLSRNST